MSGIRMTKFMENWAHEVKRVILTVAVIAACFYPDWDALRVLCSGVNLPLGTQVFFVPVH